MKVTIKEFRELIVPKLRAENETDDAFHASVRTWLDNPENDVLGDDGRAVDVQVLDPPPAKRPDVNPIAATPNAPPPCAGTPEEFREQLLRRLSDPDLDGELGIRIDGVDLARAVERAICYVLYRALNTYEEGCWRQWRANGEPNRQMASALRIASTFADNGRLGVGPTFRCADSLREDGTLDIIESTLKVAARRHILRTFDWAMTMLTQSAFGIAF